MVNKTLSFKFPAECFEEGFLLGNGILGATAYGGVGLERYSMNEVTLWSGFPTEAINTNAQAGLKLAQQLIKENKYLEAGDVIDQCFTGTYSQSYLPLCNVFIKNGIDEYTDYERSLDLTTGISTVCYKSIDSFVKRESFISHPNNVMAVKISQNNVPLTEIYIDSPLQCNVFTAPSQLILRGFAPYFDHPVGRRYSNDQKHPQYSEDDAKKGMRFKGLLHVESDGELRYNGDILELVDAHEIVIYFSAKTSFNGFDKHPYLNGAEVENTCNNYIKNAVSLGYDELKKEHVKDFSTLFNRTELIICDSETTLTTDELINEGISNARYELLFNFGKYLTISASRMGGQPANLQGIWNERLCPPWNSNYTININTQMNYMPTLALNLSECFEPYIKMVRELAVNGRKIAKEWYGVNGIITHHNTDIWRMANPVGCKIKGSHCCSFFNASFGWLLWGLIEKYRLEQDADYLSNLLYPLLVECAETYISLFSSDDSENLFLSPATSPENSFLVNGSDKASISAHSAINNAICRDILVSAAELSSILGKNAEADRYNDFAKRVAPYAIGSDGRILEWDKEHKEAEIKHRHVSHLYGLHPAREIDPIATPKLAEAAAKTLDVRGDEGTGWCIAWKANMWARLLDGNRALKLLDHQLKPVHPTSNKISLQGGTYPNMLCAHPPFQIDGNFGAAAAIIEMLVQVKGNTLHLLPALPDKWHCGEIKGIKIAGGATLDIKWKDKKVTDFKLYPAEKAKYYNIIYN